MRKGWEYKKLGEVLETTSGGTPSKSHKQYYEGGTIPWLRSGEVSKGDIYDAELYITEEGLKKSSAKLFPIDTVLIAMYGATVGQVGILKSTMCTNQAICGILPNKDFHPNFLKYVLLANKKNYLKQAIGGAQPNISQQVIKSTYIPIVKFSEQESVVTELDKINELIRLKKEQLKDFDNLAQSLFYEMFGDPVENEKGWEVKKLIEVSSLINGRAYKQNELLSEGKYKVLRVGNFFTNSNFYYSNLELEDEKYCYKGDLLFAWSASFGAFIWDEDKTIFHYHIWRVLFDKAILDIHYYQYLLNTMTSFFMNDVHGIGMVHLTKSGMEQYELPLPPLTLQRLFAQRIEQIEREKSEVQKSIQDLETLLASRMQYWFE
ncbi:MAG: restriction endonuclease subunit S [Prevotella sp.]